MARLVRKEKMVLSGLVCARKIEDIGFDGSLMIHMAYVPLYMWEMWDVTPVHTRTVESSVVFCFSKIRKDTIKTIWFLLVDNNIAN